jgi:N-acetyl-anhydromuramyl-L-alanine amidase AmpD
MGAARAAKSLPAFARWFEVGRRDLNSSSRADVHTIGGLQQALKMLGYRVTADGDYGPETLQAVTSFQMHAGIVADGIAGAQTEARLTEELNNLPVEA